MNLLYHLNYIYFSLLITSWFVVNASISTDVQSNRDSSLDCPPAELVSYVNYNYNNSEISLRTFSCPDLSIQETTGPNTQSLKLSSPARITSSYRTNSLQGRNEEQCKTTGDECQCGTACEIFFINGKQIIPLIEYFHFSFLIADCTCHGGTTLPPSTNECSILVASLTVLEEFNGSSFIVSPGSFVTLSYLVSASEPVTNFYKAFLITYPKHSIDLFIWVHQSEYLRYRVLLGRTCELKLKISMSKDELKKNIGNYRGRLLDLRASSALPQPQEALRHVMLWTVCGSYSE